MSSIEPRFAGALGAAAGLVVGLMVGATLNSGLSYQAPEGTLPPPPAGGPVSRSAVPAERDLEVEEWHQGAAPAIADLFWLSGPAVGDYSEARVQSLCEQLTLRIDMLAAVPAPPASPLDERFADWLQVLRDTEDACYSIPDETGVPGFVLLMQRPSYEMGMFLFELERKVDLTAEPASR